MTGKEVIKNIFKDIDKSIERNQSKVPVTIQNSKFYKEYLEIKKRYLNESSKIS